MNKDFEEIYKIASLFEAEVLSVDECEQILERVSEKTDDKYRADKWKYFIDNKDNLVNKYSKALGSIKKYCIYDKCESCIINKWCNHNRNILQVEASQQDAPTFADFFCGSGGLSLGFYYEGFKLSLANDIESCCIDTIALNHPETPGQHIICGDINTVLNGIKKNKRYDVTDVVIGGPPCQGFSMANRQRIIDDPRNHLYKSFINAINILGPKFFVMENVRGMLNVKEQIIEDFNKIGYSASVRLLNAADFGVPQNRERVIFIGNRVNIDNEILFDKIVKIALVKNTYVLNDAISDLPYLAAKTTPNATEQEDSLSGFTFAKYENLGSNGYIRAINHGMTSKLLFNHKARYNNPRDVEIFGRLLPGDNSADPKIADIMPYKRREKIFKDKYYKLEPDKVCKTITAHMKYDCNMYIHPYQARGLTPREAARIQSYPDNYFFRGSYTKTYMQVGNSVPPLLSEVIASVIKEALQEV